MSTPVATATTDPSIVHPASFNTKVDAATNTEVEPQPQQSQQQQVRPKLQIYTPYVPTYVPTTYRYQDVNADKQLQYIVTSHFLQKTIKWMKEDSSYAKIKKYSSALKGPQGYDIMHKILRLFVKNGYTNWYDLKAQSSLVKQFIRHKLNKI
jgi:hypothetical protein